MLTYIIIHRRWTGEEVCIHKVKCNHHSHILQEGGKGGGFTCPHVMQHRVACARAAWVQPAGLKHHAPICRTHQQQLAAYACAQRTSSLYMQCTTPTVIILKQHLSSSWSSLHAAMHALGLPRAHSICAHSL